MRPTREVAGEPAGRAAHPLCLALLRVGFAEPCRSPCTLVRSYRTVAPLPVASELAHRRSLSVALSVRSPRPGSRQHSALWSPDFPRHGHRSAVPRPPGQLTVTLSVRRGSAARVHVLEDERVEARRLQVELQPRAVLVAAADHDLHRAEAAELRRDRRYRWDVSQLRRSRS